MILTTREAAARIGLAPASLKRMRAANWGEDRPRRPGPPFLKSVHCNRVGYRVEDLDRYVAGETPQPPEDLSPSWRWRGA